MKIHRDQYPEQVRARERAQYRAPREQHLQAQRRRSERERLRRCVTDSDLALFRADPLLEQKRGLFEVIVYRVCGLQTQKLPQHLIAEHRDDLATNEQLRPEDLTLEYRRRYGHNKRAPLCCAELCQRLARITKARNARCRYQGRPIYPGKFRKGRAPIDGAKKARDSWGISKQQKARMSLVRKNRGRPGVRKKNAYGESISDWQIAKLRLEGKEALEIARKLGSTLAANSVHGRLCRIGFPPGKPCVFFRGEPVTEQLLLAHFEDLKMLRTSRRLIFRAQAHGKSQDTRLTTAAAARFLEVPVSWMNPGEIAIALIPKDERTTTFSFASANQ